MSWQEGEWSRSYNRVGSRWGGWILGAQAGVHSNWRRFGGLRKVTEGGLMRRSWVDGSEERMWKSSLRIRLSRWGPDDK